MNYGDVYRDHKGNEYVFECIAIPLAETQIQMAEENASIVIAIHHDTKEKINLVSMKGVFVSNFDVPLAVYRTKEDRSNVWAREVDDFFGYTFTVEGRLMKQFVLKGD